MTQDQVFRSFLARQFDEAKSLSTCSDVVEILPIAGMPTAPSRYVANFKGRNGLVRNSRGEIIEFDQFAVGIWFPEDYLRHVDIPRLLTYLGPHPEPWHPNIRPPFICAHVGPGTGIIEIVYACLDLWTWNLFATADEGLNRAAAQWSRRQDPNRFPVDRRPLKRRRQPPESVGRRKDEVC